MKTAPMEVTLIDHMGSDLDVVNAARVSFHKESEWDVLGRTEQYEDGRCISAHPIKSLSEADKKLIGYLAKHNHWSPFSHCYLKFRIKAPIFVARQLQKHTVGLAWNEVSRRYVDEEPEFYFPDTWRKRSASAKQGSSDETVEGMSIEEEVQHSLNRYVKLLDNGVCPEQARMVLPQNTMTEWIWSGSLYAFVRICKLRLDSHSQKETSYVAQHINHHIRDKFPVSASAFG